MNDSSHYFKTQTHGHINVSTESKGTCNPAVQKVWTRVDLQGKKPVEGTL